jgi:dTDP-glucose 4,6-dehydratase
VRLVVTGGAGFIGSTYVHHVARERPDDDVVVLDALTYAGNRKNLEGLDVELVVGDICDEVVVDRALRGADAVVHFAAESHVTRSEKDPDVFHRTNVVGTVTLLEAACRHEVGRFVHVSTDEVYGDARDHEPFREDEKEPGDHQATSAYAKSKALADDVAQSYRDRTHVNIVRPTNNFGPRQFPEKAYPRWVTRCLRGEPISLWGVGDQVRDWLFAPDNARAIDLVLRTAPAGEIYNIGANHEPEIRNRDLAHWLAGRLHDRGARIEHQLDRREHHDFRYSVDTTKISALGWRPTDDVWGSFEETLRWYEANESWWQPLIDEAERIYA